MNKCRLTSKYLRPVSSYKYCILPSVIITGSLYHARIAARQTCLSPRVERLVTLQPRLTWIQVPLAKVDDFLLGRPCVLHRLVVKRRKFWLSHIASGKRSLRTLPQTGQVPLRSDGITERSCYAAHGLSSDTWMCCSAVGVCANYAYLIV